MEGEGAGPQPHGGEKEDGENPPFLPPSLPLARIPFLPVSGHFPSFLAPTQVLQTLLLLWACAPSPPAPVPGLGLSIFPGDCLRAAAMIPAQGCQPEARQGCLLNE